MSQETVPVSYDRASYDRYGRWLRNVPFLEPEYAPKLEQIAERLDELGADDFTWSCDFDPAWLAELMRHGFLTMATDVGPLVALLPKLHRERCVMHLENMKVQRGTRKKAKNFKLSIGTAFDEVVAGLREQHGKSKF